MCVCCVCRRVGICISGVSVCVCVCGRARARARACVCVCVCVHKSIKYYKVLYN